MMPQTTPRILSCHLRFVKGECNAGLRDWAHTPSHTCRHA